MNKKSWKLIKSRFYKKSLNQWGATVAHKNFLISLLLSITLPIIIVHTPASEVHYLAIAGILATISALSFGACFTGLTIAIGLHGGSDSRHWSNLKNKRGEYYFENLIYVISWSCFVQLVLVISLLFGFLVKGDSELISKVDFWWDYPIVVIISASFTYAIIQLLVVITTFYNISIILIKVNSISR